MAEATPPAPASLLEVATDAAAEAASMVLARAGASFALETKASDIDLVTEVDHASERLLIERLLDARPDDGILGEEGGSIVGTSGVEWVIDPIDGTTSFVYGLPGFSVSVAARIDGETVAAVVNAPAIATVYSAALGHGTTRNGRPVTCTSITELSKAMVATGFSPDHDRRRRQGEHLADLIPDIRDIRRMGSAALDLAAVAAGQVDAYFEIGLAEWDWAAGVLLVAEAGGFVIAERDPDTGRAFVAAAAPGIADALVDRLRSSGADRV